MTPEKEKAIRDEAAKKFPDRIGKGIAYSNINFRQNEKRKAYIAGATAEAEKNESNAVEFADFAWDKWIRNYDKAGFQQPSTEELYSLYINSK